MITIFHTLDLAEANFAQSILLAEGIETFSPNQNTASIGYSNPIGGIEIQVHLSLQEKASAILEEKGFLKV